MKAVILFCVLTLLPSCQSLKRSGEIVCEVHHSVAEGISAGGEYLGGPGNLIADIINAALEIGCRIYAAAVAIPADVSDGPGEAEVEGEVTDGKEPAHPK